MIDIHTHLWPLEETPDYLKRYFTGRDKKTEGYELTAEGILDSMDAAGIQYSIVSALSFKPEYTNDQLEKINDYVLKECQKSKGRLIPFCTINPFEENAVQYLKKYIGQEGFKGLKLHCIMQEFYPNDKRVYPVYEFMEKEQKPVLFHTGGIGITPTKDRYGQPVHFDDIACDFPQLPLILGHAGRIWYNETAMLLRKHKNIVADISTNIGRLEEYKTKPLEELFKIVKSWAGSTKSLVFGSDYPFYGQKETKDALRAVDIHNAFLTREDLNDILFKNAWDFCKKYQLV